MDMLQPGRDLVVDICTDNFFAKNKKKIEASGL
jgi:hypothetical protein